MEWKNLEVLDLNKAQVLRWVAIVESWPTQVSAAVKPASICHQQVKMGYLNHLDEKIWIDIDIP